MKSPIRPIRLIICKVLFTWLAVFTSASGFCPKTYAGEMNHLILDDRMSEGKQDSAENSLSTGPSHYSKPTESTDMNSFGEMLEEHLALERSGLPTLSSCLSPDKSQCSQECSKAVDQVKTLSVGAGNTEVTAALTARKKALLQKLIHIRLTIASKLLELNQGSKVKKLLIKRQLDEIRGEMDSEMSSNSFSKDVATIDIVSLIQRNDKKLTEKIFKKIVAPTLTVAAIGYSVGGLVSQTGLSTSVTAAYASTAATGVGVSIVVAALLANALDYHYNSDERQIQEKLDLLAQGSDRINTALTYLYATGDVDSVQGGASFAVHPWVALSVGNITSGLSYIYTLMYPFLGDEESDRQAYNRAKLMQMIERQVKESVESLIHSKRDVLLIFRSIFRECMDECFENRTETPVVASLDQAQATIRKKLADLIEFEKTSTRNFDLAMEELNSKMIPLLSKAFALPLYAQVEHFLRFTPVDSNSIENIDIDVEKMNVTERERELTRDFLRQKPSTIQRYLRQNFSKSSMLVTHDVGIHAVRHWVIPGKQRTICGYWIHGTLKFFYITDQGIDCKMWNEI